MNCREGIWFSVFSFGVFFLRVFASSRELNTIDSRSSHCGIVALCRELIDGCSGGRVDWCSGVVLMFAGVLCGQA